MHRVAILILAVVLAGCDGPMLTQEGSPFTRIDGLYDYGAGARDLKLTVHGNPFPMPDDVFARVVETDVQTPLLRQPTHPTLTPGPSARPGYELIFVFSPAVTLGGQDLCEGKTAHRTGDGVRVIGAFCVSGRAETEVVGQTAADGAGDVRFLELMRQMMLSLFRPDARSTSHGRPATIR